MNEIYRHKIRIQKKARVLPAEGIRVMQNAKATHLIEYDECAHLQSGGVGSLGKEGYESPVITEAGRPGHVPDTEQARVSVYLEQLGNKQRLGHLPKGPGSPTRVWVFLPGQWSSLLQILRSMEGEHLQT